MKKTIELPLVKGLQDALVSIPQLIQVIIGPRQVGKTTGVRQLLASRDPATWCYYSADGAIQKSSDWLLERWYEARSNPKIDLIVVDEIQNIEAWSSVLKQVWDEAALNTHTLKLIVLGSSSLSLQQGLHESLAGRFLLHRLHHWSFAESHAAYGLSLDEYLQFGGYPGSYPLIDTPERWYNYINDSIIDAVIGKDILSHVRVRSPALFRQCFEIASAYPAQEISYTKLLGQLQERGNTDLVKHYLEHYEGGFLLKQLFKYSGRHIVRRTSSPKLLPLCPALYSVGLAAPLNSEERGRSFELAVGMALLRLPGNLYYWRERNSEVDFVYIRGKHVMGIEVKSGRKKRAPGLTKFKDKFGDAELLVVTPDNLLDIETLVGEIIAH